MVSVTCPKCKARYKIPDSVVGKKVKCPNCAVTFPARPPDAAPPSKPQASADAARPPSIRVACKYCGARIRLPARAAGRRVKCPKCARVLRIAGPPAAPPPPATTAAGSDSDLLSELEFAEQTAQAVAPAPRAAPTRQPQTGGPTCPSCQQSLPPDAKICVQCGISLETGRSIIITQDEKLDEIYAAAERTIALISWVIWSGIYPIASEAFGTCKPYVTRGIALVTIVASLAFLPHVYTEGEVMPNAKNLMLWGGDPDFSVEDYLEQQRREWRSEHPELPELIIEETFAAGQVILEARLADAGEYRPTQLITHALLHDGILHLAVNLLFLMVLGARVNALVGNLWTLVLYILFAAVAGLAHRAASADEFPFPMLGASGAVMGMAGMYLVLFPAHKVHMVFWWRWPLLFLCHLSARFFALRGFWVVLFYIAFDVLYTVFGLEDEVAHWAHLGGFIAGMAVAIVLLVTRLVNARGGDLFSVVLGRHAWALIGRPRA